MPPDILACVFVPLHCETLDDGTAERERERGRERELFPSIIPSGFRVILSLRAPYYKDDALGFLNIANAIMYPKPYSAGDVVLGELEPPGFPV